jgi:hypothetical protein
MLARQADQRSICASTIQGNSEALEWDRARIAIAICNQTQRPYACARAHAREEPAFF